MRQRKTTFSTGPVKAAEWRRCYGRLSSQTVEGVLVKDAPTLAAFEAAQYVACTDSLRVIVRANNGSIALYQWGEFRGWYTSLPAAVHDARQPWLPPGALR